MADHLVSIYGTEKDKINCPFYHKIGACRHGDRCSRVHNKPLFSQTILLQNMYVSPDQIFASAAAQGLSPPNIPQEILAHHFDDFYNDVYEEMAKYGPVENIYVCENLADHLAGNTYVKFSDDRSTQLALESLASRWYAGRIVKAEFSPVTDFREGKCRPFERTGRCERGDYCHFMHLRRQPQGTSPAESASPEEVDRSNREYEDTSRHTAAEHVIGRDRLYRDSPRKSSLDYLSRGYGTQRSRNETQRRNDGERRWERERRPLYEKDRFRGSKEDKSRERYSHHDRSYPASRERRP